MSQISERSIICSYTTESPQSAALTAPLCSKWSLGRSRASYRGRCPHRPGSLHGFYGNLRRIRSCPMGRCGHRPLQSAAQGYSCIRICCNFPTPGLPARKILRIFNRRGRIRLDPPAGFIPCWPSCRVRGFSLRGSRRSRARTICSGRRSKPACRRQCCQRSSPSRPPGY